ncbi:MAG: hypothetical protein JWL77_3233 [Chthonomonadaceae bacterium]|nr:hypothetical protein [Chthonomonadaceae bacterium]
MSTKTFAGGLRHIACLGFAVAVCGTAGAQTLFYSGDINNNGFANQINGPFSGRTFDTFVVNSPLGWNVSSIFSNDIQLFPAPNVNTQADWSIRTGMGPGVGGTIVASGVSSATQTPTGRTVGGATGFIEYTIQVSGLSLILAPGTYWLQVTPINGSAQWYNSTTSGTNGINAVNSNAGLLDSPANGYNYRAMGTDFSMGVNGTAITPEGSSLAMFALGGLPLAIGFGRKFRRRRA